MPKTIKEVAAHIKKYCIPQVGTVRAQCGQTHAQMEQDSTDDVEEVSDADNRPAPATKPAKVPWNYQAPPQSDDDDDKDPEWSGLQQLARLAFYDP